VSNYLHNLQRTQNDITAAPLLLPIDLKVGDVVSYERLFLCCKSSGGQQKSDLMTR
jgi:hypothetical protein